MSRGRVVATRGEAMTNKENWFSNKENWFSIFAVLVVIEIAGLVNGWDVWLL